MLECDVCRHQGPEAEFHDDETEQWRCPVCQADESAISVNCETCGARDQFRFREDMIHTSEYCFR